MKLDWVQIALLAFAAWILYERRRSGDQVIDWMELLAIAIISQVISDFWRQA